MRITADTNVLIRAVTNDDPNQSPLAAEMLRNAEIIAVTLPALCEFVWVLKRWYRFDADEIARAIRNLIENAKVRTDRPAVEAGLALCSAGGDFADGAIAFEGRRLGGTVFASFDRTAVDLVGQQGGDAVLLAR